MSINSHVRFILFDVRLWRAIEVNRQRAAEETNKQKHNAEDR